MHFVDAKGILSAQNGMNVYRGCTHGCVYCDSRSKCYGFTHDFEDVEVKRNAPELLEDMHTDPEAGMYVAYYDLTPENEAKADKFNELIHKLVEEPELLYDFMREHAWDVEWD